MFYETQDGKLINLDRVRNVDVGRQKGALCDVTFWFGPEEGVRALVCANDFHDGALVTSQPVTSPAGFYRLDWYGDDVLHRYPVIAWEKDQFGEMLPLCAERNYGVKAHAVEQPDGRVVDIRNEEHLDSPGEWLAARINEARAEVSKAA